MAASIELIREAGVDALTVAEVGRRVGVSSAAPYKHFERRPRLSRHRHLRRGAACPRRHGRGCPGDHPPGQDRSPAVGPSRNRALRIITGSLLLGRIVSPAAT
ncbi:helix-turn-helix domain-containing protein [Comamonas sp. JC664]|uniref:helix-turn-helix domain-containing protein n=1 Tax=Comamonas sp. JC664 TaxID=2801917 RepID=UPI00174DE31A|nr:helix-turn-helix transcriptional regulator [Comamonas sp. JC664]